MKISVDFRFGFNHHKIKIILNLIFTINEVMAFDFNDILASRSEIHIYKEKLSSS